MKFYTKGYVTDGASFIYKGVRYGCHTKILFTEEFYKSHKETIGVDKNSVMYDSKIFQYYRTLHSIVMENGKIEWRFGTTLISNRYYDIDPEKDIEKIIIPVYYMEPKELVMQRLSNGTWINYIWAQTLFFIFCLIISPVFKQWYLIWTMGTYLYLRTSYITLSKGELCNGGKN